MKTLTFIVVCFATFILSSCGKSAKERAQDSAQSDTVLAEEESIKESITVRFNALYQRVSTRGDELPDLEKEFTSEAYYVCTRQPKSLRKVLK